MQLCYIHFYQKIARKKVAHVNAALRSFGFFLCSKKYIHLEKKTQQIHRINILFR